ncbi:hypothetical protein GY14_24140 [Delftia tsuruhatensis]|nr:hypothetical protein GY14_24140 [Delftia tsuruhatensis]
MDLSEKFQQHLEHVCSTKGLGELEKRINRGDYMGPSLEAARSFVSTQKSLRLQTYMLIPEYSALRQANAAEQSNKTSRLALGVSILAVVVSLVALALQVFQK